MDIYINNCTTVFTLFDLSPLGRALGTIAFAIVGALLGFYIGYKIYNNKRKEETL
jgi:hypothetical protein